MQAITECTIARSAFNASSFSRNPSSSNAPAHRLAMMLGNFVVALDLPSSKFHGVTLRADFLISCSNSLDKSVSKVRISKSGDGLMSGKSLAGMTMVTLCPSAARIEAIRETLNNWLRVSMENITTLPPSIDIIGNQKTDNASKTERFVVAILAFFSALG